MDTGSFIIHIKTKDFYEDVADDVEKKNDILNYDFDRPFPTKKNSQFNERQTRRKDYDEICSS